MKNNNTDSFSYERGAALVTVLIATLLLGTAAIAMLSAVGASSKNNTDALSEAKAYYAAESGIQAAINLMRFNGVTYSAAALSGDLHPSDANVGSGLPYNADGVVELGTESYKVHLSDPDNTQNAANYSTAGTFRQPDGSYEPTRVFTTIVDGVARTTTFSFDAQPSTPITHPMSTPALLGTLNVEPGAEGAATIATNQFPIAFRIDFGLAAPVGAARTFYGQIASTGTVTFTTGYTYELGGATISLCSSNTTCPSTFSMTGIGFTSSNSRSFYTHFTPFEPYRLLLRSTGYGPNGATKELEAILQRNYFNNIGAAAAITMLGPGSSPFQFSPGTSNQMSIDGVSVPSVIVSDQTALNKINAELQGPPDRSSNVVPAPQVAGNSLPSWQASPQAMEDFLAPFIASAQNSDRVIANNTQLDTGAFGNLASGTGLTYCSANCTIKGDGGGVLIVRGTLTLTGNPQFRGIIIVTGEGGVTRQGGGNKFTLYGNLVIAPYNPNNLAAGFLPPQYDVKGGPGDIEFNDDVDLANTFNNTSGISNFILAIAEK